MARLLRTYEIKAAADESEEGGDDKGAWRRGPKPRQHVEAMRAMLAEVRAHDATAADRFKKRIDKIEASLQPYKRPSYCMATSQVEWQPYQRPAPPPRATGARRGGKTGVGKEKVSLSEQGQRALKQQQHLQEGLTDELVELAAGIKANNLAMEGSLKESARALDHVEGRLEKNLGAAKTAVGRQSALYKLNASGSCWTWIILFVVGVVFAWMYLFIKFTSDRTLPRRY